MILDRSRELAARAAWTVQPVRPGRPYRLLAESQWWPARELEALQIEALRDVLRAAARASFYRRRLRAANLAPDDVRSVADLAALPPLERGELQREGVAGLGVPGARGRLKRTSGSIGRPVTVLWPYETIAWLEANARRADEWLGVGVCERRVAIPNSLLAKDLRTRLANGILNVTVFHGELLADRAAVVRLGRSLERRPAALVAGVSNGLYALALVLLEEGLAARARACWSGGNRLHAHYRTAIERALGCPVHERYRCIELGAIAYQCPEGGKFHVCSESVVVEVVRDDGTPAGPGEVGHVLVTGLRNRAMPLVRYRIGDLVEAAAGEPCRCGRGLPVLGRLLGRSNELLRAADGRPVVPEAVSAVMSSCAESVLEFRVVQREDLSLAVSLVQRDQPPPAPYRQRVAEALDALVALPGAASVERVAAIRSGEGGKLRHVYSHAIVPREPAGAGG